MRKWLDQAGLMTQADSSNLRPKSFFKLGNRCSILLSYGDGHRP